MAIYFRQWTKTVNHERYALMRPMNGLLEISSFFTKYSPPPSNLSISLVLVSATNRLEAWCWNINEHGNSVTRTCYISLLSCSFRVHWLNLRLSLYSGKPLWSSHRSRAAATDPSRPDRSEPSHYISQYSLAIPNNYKYLLGLISSREEWAAGWTTSGSRRFFPV